MKIIILVLGFFEHLEYQENLLLKQYEKLGHEVHVITSTNKSILTWVKQRNVKDAPEETYKIGQTSTIHRLRFLFDILNRLQRFADITPLLEEIQPDLITVHNTMLNITDCVRYVKHHPECRMILDFHGDYINSGTNWLSLHVLHGVIFRYLFHQARPYLSRIFPVTPGSLLFLKDVYKIPPREMEVLPLGADMELARRCRSSSAREDIRREWNVPPDGIVIFTGGKFAPLKRFEIVIEAIEQCADAKIHLAVVGDASPGDEAYAEALRNRALGQSNVHFTGWLSTDEIYRYLAAADFAVFPRGQSILWQHAIGMGLPLIVGDWEHDWQDMSYLNQHDNIIVVPPENLAADICKNIRLLINNEPLRRQMSIGADQVSAEQLDWEMLAQRTLQYNRKA